MDSESWRSGFTDDQGSVDNLLDVDWSSSDKC
jgi:hypothetical protein